jgi:YggT family protein
MPSVLSQIAALLLDATCGVLVYLALLRFLMQWRRASFYNPLGGFVLTFTDWAVRPLRRLIPVSRGLDWATLALALLTELVIQAVRAALHLPGALGATGSTSAIGWILIPVLGLARELLGLLTFLVIVDAVLGWVNPRAALGPVIASVVRPFAEPLRRRIPLVGGIDLAPWVLVILLQIGQLLLSALAPVVLALG